MVSSGRSAGRGRRPGRCDSLDRALTRGRAQLPAGAGAVAQAQGEQMKARLTLIVAALTAGAIGLQAQGGRRPARPYGYDPRATMGGDYYVPPAFAGNPL